MRTLVFLAALAVALAPLATATLTDPVQDDAGTGTDAGDSAAEATRLVARQPPGLPPTSQGAYNGFAVAVDDPHDWYSFQLDGASDQLGTIDVAFGSGSQTCRAPPIPVDTATIDLLLVSPDGTTHAIEAGPVCGHGAKLTVRDAVPGEWLVRVHVDLALAHAFPAPFGAYEDASPAVSSEYFLVLGCEPRC